VAGSRNVLEIPIEPRLGEIKRLAAEWFAAPPEDFVRLFATHIYDRSVTARVRETFTRLIVKAFAQFINARVNDRLKQALRGTGAESEPLAEPKFPEGESAEPGSDIETTPDELAGFAIVRAIVASHLPYSRVFLRDQKSYAAILADDNNRKPLARLRFNGPTHYLGIFDADKIETRVRIDQVEDIYLHVDALHETAQRYE